MADYVLSATLDLKDRFSSKIENSFKKAYNFQKRIEKMDERLKKFGQAPKLKEFEKDMNRAVEKIDQAKIKFSNLGNPLKIFENNASRSVDKINRVVGKLKNIFKWGVIGGTGTLIGASKIGADFEALGARMDTAFQGNKKKSAEYFKWANEFANKTPFSNDEVIDATVRLKSYGYDPKRMMTMLGDFAGAYGKTLEQSIEAYADASRGEFERLKEFGIQKDEVLNYAKETMGKEVKMSGEKVKDMDTFMKALEGLIKSRSKDGMKHLANTLSGMLSTTKGLLKYNIAKLVGVTDEGEVRAGSLMDRVKKKFEKFNNYMQSSEGQKAIQKWSEVFDEAIPKIIKIIDNIKEKIKDIAGEDFMEKLNNSIKKFDPKSFNQALDEVQKKIDKITDRALRLGGAFAGMQLMKINPYLGALAMVGGAFTPELIKAGEKTVEYLEPTFDYNKHRKEMLEKLKLEEKKVPIRISGASEEINKELDDYFNKKQKNTGVEWYGFGKRVGDLKSENDEIMNFIRDREEKKKEQNINITNNNSDSYTININGVTNADDKVAFNNLSKEMVKAIENIADKRIDKSMSILADGLNFV